MRYTTRFIVPPRVRRSGPMGTPGGAYAPQALGVRKSFGFGDRLGVATPGHLAALNANPGFAPIFAQQSVREMTLTGRTPGDVLTSAVRAVNAARFRQPWGADADGLRQPPDVDTAASAGFTAFTIDPAEFVRSEADGLPAGELPAAVDALVADGAFPEDWSGPYLERAIDLPGNRRLRIELEPLQRAVIKFGRAIGHCARMSQSVARACQGRSFEVEVSFEGIGSPVTPLEHLFIGLELEARGVRMTSLTLDFAGEFERGDGSPEEIEAFETRLKEHVAVAEFCGPYKLGFRGDFAPPAFYPVIGRCCGDALHVKTSGASYLEALRVVLRVDPGLFAQIVQYSRTRFTEDRASSPAAPSVEEIAGLPNDVTGDEEAVFLDTRHGRALLDLTYGSVLGEGQDDQQRPFKEAILELLDRHADIYHELLAAHFGTQLQGLNAG